MLNKSRLLMVVALASGALFGLGISISGMINPEKVQGFLNITREWDPSLGLVMAAALAVFMPGYYRWRQAGQTQCVLGNDLPKLAKPIIDKRLVIGASLFGAGWGWVGICPGSAMALLASLQWQAGLFVLAMLAGFWLVKKMQP
ncbi:DUF6691 family protein [Oceanisphaera avium]|uniref:YeeE/YedE family protein n=1 Tax=Oceanisphaera avium TaxID=1903694 RepID=A0A1Y0CWA8_9GAMM|nr:DUF6691 family protein [Oceanisphaera avium]ART79529.1 hypothetical protein CBP12_04670 [Oceanisphaera avium]